jgi:hypothetical protein
MTRSPLTSEERARVRELLDNAITIVDGRSLDGRPLGDLEDRLYQYRTLIEVGKEPKPLRMSRPRFVLVPAAMRSAAP